MSDEMGDLFAEAAARIRSREAALAEAQRCYRDLMMAMSTAENREVTVDDFNRHLYGDTNRDQLEKLKAALAEARKRADDVREQFVFAAEEAAKTEAALKTAREALKLTLGFALVSNHPASKRAVDAAEAALTMEPKT